ncbi:MAG TPA: hypothetical protein VEH27_10715 [Methylomirabilota bacterium]|nr:hypothetical protein [Methylomirabilota bacterium]
MCPIFVASFSRGAVLAFGGLLNGHAAQKARGSSAFEEFIANPPVIEELVYSVSDGAEGNARHYQVKWQTNAFFIRELASLEDARRWTLSPFVSFMAMHVNRVWQFDDSKGMTSYKTNKGSLVSLPAKL